MLAALSATTIVIKCFYPTLTIIMGCEMGIFGLDLNLIPTTKLITGAVILLFACAIASVPLISNNPFVKFIKRGLLLLSLVGIIYLNIHSYSSNPAIFLIAEVVVLILCYKLYLTVLAKMIAAQGEADVADRYYEDIKRKRALR